MYMIRTVMFAELSEGKVIRFRSLIHSYLFSPKNTSQTTPVCRVINNKSYIEVPDKTDSRYR